MTTDITELAQLRAELSNPANGSKDHLRKLALLLVDELEKAQAKIIELQRKYEIDPRTHEIIDLEERVAELESEVEKWKQEAESWERVAEKQLATAIALESRAVMLERQLVDHVDEELLITIKAASALGSLPKTGEVQNTNFPAIPDGYVMVAASLLSELRDWAHPEIEEYCEMWAGRRDDEFPALRKVIADADALLAAARSHPAVNTLPCRVNGSP